MDDSQGTPVPPTFDEYAESRGEALLRFAYLVCRDQQLAEDLTQEALARAYRRWRHIERTDNPDVYVRRIVINQLLSLRRRAGWRREIPAAEFPELASRQDLASEQCDREAVWQMVATLPPRQRAVLVLRHYEDLSDTDIARVLGCSEATVRAHASKAHARLRETYAAHSLTPGDPR